jgi:UDP-N-acetylglucosamine 2-epimerase (non-hydrolysing)
VLEGTGLGKDGRLRVVEPMGYLGFLRVMSEARLVLTDSGGVQEETTILKVPCPALRESTESPITVEMG